jgi:hypothetical protein
MQLADFDKGAIMEKRKERKTSDRQTTEKWRFTDSETTQIN